MATLEKVKIGVINESINMLDHFVALDAGIYQDEGLDVELVIQLWPDSLGWLDTGEVLVSSSTRVPEAIVLNRAPYQYVLITRREMPHYIIARPEIRMPRELKGKTVWGSGAGSINYYMTLDWLRANGLEPGVDVKVNTFERPNEAFFNGEVPPWARPTMRMATADAVMVVPPEAQWLVQEAGWNQLVELCEPYPNLMIHGLAGHPDVMRKNADLVRRAVRAHTRTAQVIQDDQETTVGIMMRRWGLNRTVAEGIWEMMHWRFIAESDPSWFDELLTYEQYHLQQRFPDKHIAKPETTTLVDKSFLP